MPPNAQLEYLNARLGGKEPDPALKVWEPPGVYHAIDQAHLAYIGEHENLGEPEDLTNLIVAATGIGDIANLLRGAGQIGLKELGSTAAKEAASTAASTAEKRSLADVLAAVAGKRAALRGAVKRGAAKAEPEAVAGARKAAAEKAGAAVAKLPAPVRAAGRAATLPVRRPLTAPFAVQTPAVVTGKGSFMDALEGKGTYADIASTVGNAAASVVPGEAAQNLVRDVFNLPAVALPSVYLPVAGAVEAAQGDPARLDRLWHEYSKTGLIPALARGDAHAALEAIKHHPLFTALEVGGAGAIAGRGAGAFVRGATHGRVGGIERPPVHIQGAEQYGNVNAILGREHYSPDLLRQAAQRLYDRRRGPHATPKQAERVMRRDLPDRYAFEREQIRRVNRQEIVKAMQAAAPKKGRFKIDKASADVVSLAVQRIIRSPETFYEDLRGYRGQLEQAAKSGELTRSELSANRALVKSIDKAIHSANPEEVVRAANAFIEHHGKLVHNIVDQGLLDPRQAERAALIPFARVHMGASYKKGVGTVDKNGELLTNEAIKAEMERRGVAMPGFLTHQPRTASARGAWYRAFFPDRQSLSKKVRTGAAAAHGTYDASYRALVEQAARSRSIVDATGGFDGLIRRFGIKPPEGVKDLGTAHDALLNPERYGWDLPPDVNLRPIRTAPFLALKRELVAAARHQDLLDPENSQTLHGLAEKTLTEAEQPGGGPVAYVPDALYGRLLEHFHPSNTLEKAVQAVNTGFKGAVLPFSPSFYVGNAADNYLRAALAGIGPSDIFLGRKLMTGKTAFGRKISEPVDVGPRESIQPGAMYGSVARTQPYRDARQFQNSSLGGLARAMHAVRETPGPKQAYAAFKASSGVLLELNSRLFERLPQYGAIGKEARRQLQATSGHWHHALMIGDDAFRDLANGLRNTDKQIQYAKAVEQAFGNWGKNGPAARGVLANLVPFWQWARASTRFVLLTLPAHHPIKTGLIAAAAEMTEAERKKFGLDKFADEPLPGFLQGTIPSGGGVLRNLPKYTSFGVFGDYPEFIGRMFFAQGSSPLNALEGLDWKGDKLTKADGSPADDTERAKAAILAAGEQFIPGINLLEGALGGELEKFSPLATESGEKLDYLRKLSKSQEITVPVKGSGSSSSGADYGNVFSGGAGSSVDYGSVFSGGH